MRKILLAIMFPFLMLSCVDFETQTDVSKKLSIDVPKDWVIDKKGNEFISITTFSDTTANFKDRLVFDISWESDKMELTAENTKSIDSLIVSKGWLPKNQNLRNMNGFEGYYYDIIGYDSIGKFKFATNNRYLNKKGKEGTIFFLVTRYKEKLSAKDSVLVERIFKTLERK
ncbi:hypothetical protein [Formosa algae]|uniref:hypothetical protein n=1 Tax=Formosa algae TaxID=225843 RepID=UPI000CCEA703|nr:hypothetical protein [Formosa algae]PNW25297.1 hypothetical protein BKP44_19735 [Formosa algae]